MGKVIWIKRGNRLTAIEPKTLQFIEGHRNKCTLLRWSSLSGQL